MLITHRSTYTATNVIADTEGITSNCNTITFDNCGETDCEIHINGDAVNYILLPAGKNIDLGGRIDSIVMDTFDIVFVGLGTGICNIIREAYQMLT